MSKITIEPYTKNQEKEWNSFVRQSRNGTFLLDRSYMDYHSHIFQDISLIFRRKNKIEGVFPANIEGDNICSHRGLTYGGLVLSESATTVMVLEMMDKLLEFCAEKNIQTVFYKTIPSIYNKLPADEDLYALYRNGGVLYRRDVMTVISPEYELSMSKERVRILKKAAQYPDVQIEESDSWDEYWRILTARLQEKYATTPTHSPEEIKLLASRFPQSIKLIVAKFEGEIRAGVVLFNTPQVDHVQYIASDSVARDMGLLDLIFVKVITDSKNSKKWFDFGVSTEHDGHLLNHGLARYKEGFGGRSIVHDFYRIDIT